MKNTNSLTLDKEEVKSYSYKPNKLTLKRGFIALAIMYIVQTLVGVLFAYGLNFINAQTDNEVTIDIQIVGMTSVLLSGVIILILFWFDIRRSGPGFLSEIGFRKSIIKVNRAVVWILLLLVSTHFLAWIYRSVVLPIFGHGGIKGSASELFAYILETESVVAITGFLSLGLIIGPVMEEIVFRGYLQSSLAKRVPSWLAILITSVIFMLGHGPMILWPMYFVYSLAWGWIYMATKSLHAAIILHVLSNLFYTFIVLFDWDILA